MNLSERVLGLPAYLWVIAAGAGLYAVARMSRTRPVVGYPSQADLDVATEETAEPPSPDATLWPQTAQAVTRPGMQRPIHGLELSHVPPCGGGMPSWADSGVLP